MKARNGERGWTLLAMHDPSFRRGLWYRVRGSQIEMCSGREGDDAFVSLPFTQDLLEVLDYAASNTDSALRAIRSHRERHKCRVTRGCIYVRGHEQGKCWAMPKLKRGAK